jgi:hypothetical protein
MSNLATWEAEMEGGSWLEASLGKIKIVHETPPPPKQPQQKMGWRYGSNGRMPAMQAQNPESHKKRKTRNSYLNQLLSLYK